MKILIHFQTESNMKKLYKYNVYNYGKLNLEHFKNTTVKKFLVRLVSCQDLHYLMKK
jgi:hypothetical protein